MKGGRGGARTGCDEAELDEEEEGEDAVGDGEDAEAFRHCEYVARVARVALRKSVCESDRQGWLKYGN